MIKKTYFSIDIKTKDLFISKNQINPEEYLKEPNQEQTCFVIDSNKCNNLKNLFKHFSQVFNFPDYFGNNWHALNDCMSDFNWFLSYDFKIYIINPLMILSENDIDKKYFWEMISELDKLHPDGNTSGDEEIYLNFILQVERENLHELEILLNKYKIKYN